MARTLLVPLSMVSHSHRRPLLLALATLSLLHASGSAWADDPAQPPPPPYPQPYPPPPQSYPPGQPVYTAPLAQQTQSTYVPQSVALSGPKQLHAYDDNQPPPDGYTAVHRKRKGLIIGGGVTLGVSYGYSALAAAIGEDLKNGDGENEVAALWIPVAGPFVQMLSTDSATAKVLLVGLGGAQLAGAIMLFSGMSSHKRVFVRNDLVSGMSVGPMVGDGASGMSLSGRF